MAIRMTRNRLEALRTVYSIGLDEFEANHTDPEYGDWDDTMNEAAREAMAIINNRWSEEN